MASSRTTRSPWSADDLRGAGRTLWAGLPGMSPTFLVVALLACVLVPLPTVVVDLLLSLSLAGSVLLMVASLKVRRTSDFLGFPQLLLLATLYRLALNVSTTRLILSQADAGRVIDAFAGFVVRGDLIVGGVMFAIITVIQYLVIARGAERVAEVGARFALDGMPGHQAAIDADLKAGVISAREAAQRRAELNEVSTFHGAMDGAIRFVKGDAVAGLVITTINLGGGLAIGMGRMGYSWQESLEVYGRLTIGDGLLAQIPALLVSLAAGVLVSRVDRQREGEPPRWLQPAMLVVPAVMLAGLALVPGMPWLAFATTSVALLAVAVGLAARRAGEPGPIPQRAELTVLASAADFPDLRAGTLAMAGLRQRCADALGVDPPPFALAVDPARVRGSLEVRLGERVLHRDSPAAPAEAAADPTSAKTGDELVLTTFRAAMAHADAFVDLQDIDEWVERARERRPAVVAAALEVARPLDLLHVVRGLLRERISLPPFEAILEVFADGRVFRQTAERPHWPEHARERLAGFWVRDLLDGVGRLGSPHWVRAYPDAEEQLMAHAALEADGWKLALTPTQRRAWISALRPGEGPHVILCSAPARPVLATLFRAVHPHVAVISVSELERAELAVPSREAVDWVHAPG